MSPNLFNSVLEEVFKKLRWKGRGFKIKIRSSNLFDFRSLSHLRLADDVVLVARNGKKLGEMAEELLSLIHISEPTRPY